MFRSALTSKPGPGWIAVCLMAASTTALAQSDEPTLDELLDLQPDKPATQEDERPQDSTDAGTPLDESVQRMLSGEQAADAFEQAVREMDDVSQRLGRRRDAGTDTQRMQQAIIDKLDQVIAAARRQQQQSSSSSSSGGQGQQQQSQRQQDKGAGQVAQQPSGAQRGQAGQPGAQSQSGQAHSGEASPGSAQEGETSGEPMRELRREWGSLPPRLRDEISEGLNERFSPVYRELTESYYRELAEEE